MLSLVEEEIVGDKMVELIGACYLETESEIEDIKRELPTNNNLDFTIGRQT